MTSTESYKSDTIQDFDELKNILLEMATENDQETGDQLERYIK